ncbi:cytochrome P450 2J2-like [Tiliqua scincoides]|uniref:cytochrome P450 2J2-like n=1 Tax=Tiliqua scincoides TaxID=71010 RepID=UPI0034635885
MFPVIPLFLGFIVFLFARHILNIHRARSKLPAGPAPLPVIGNLRLLGFQLHHETLLKIASVYGDIYTLWLGHTPIIVLNGFQAVKEVLINHSEDFAERPLQPFLEDLLGGAKGIIFANGRAWKQQRRFSLTVLRNLGLGKRSLEDCIHHEARHLVQAFAQEQAKPMDPFSPIFCSVNKLIATILLGHCFSMEDDTLQRLNKGSKALEEFSGTIWPRHPSGVSRKWCAPLEARSSCFTARSPCSAAEGVPWVEWKQRMPPDFGGDVRRFPLFDAFPGLMKHLQPILNRTLTCLVHWKDLERLVKEEIQQHQRSWSPEEPRDFIDLYLAQLEKSKDDPTSTFTEANLVQVIIDLFIAGSDTSTIALYWALLYMMAYPEIQERVQEELDTVVDPSRVIRYEDRKILPFTNAVIHETQRMSSMAAIGIVHKCTKDTNVQGLPIRKGTTILPNIFSVHYDHKQWETPRKFNPNHFLDKDGNFINKEAFLPFSAGIRVCLGEKLARATLFIFFTSLLRVFRFQLPEGVKEINSVPMLGAALHPNPYKTCAVPR